MAYYKITKNKKGELVARIQASGKDVATGKNKIYTKRIHNENKLTDAKFRKYIEKAATEFENEIQEAYKEGTTEIRIRVPTFEELMFEWMENIKANLSYSYYKKAEETSKKFGAFLKDQKLDRLPINEIKVRDIQIFLNSFSLGTYEGTPTVKLKKDFPTTVNFRELLNENIVNDYTVQLFLISPNAVYITEQSVGTPFGRGTYSPDENLMTFELRVQKNSQDWGYGGYSIYKERQPAVISYIFQVYRG